MTDTVQELRSIVSATPERRRELQTQLEQSEDIDERFLLTALLDSLSETEDLAKRVLARWEKRRTDQLNEAMR